jgi:hypothetical protein
MLYSGWLQLMSFISVEYTNLPSLELKHDRCRREERKAVSKFRDGNS